MTNKTKPVLSDKDIERLFKVEPELSAGDNLYYGALKMALSLVNSVFYFIFALVAGFVMNLLGLGVGFWGAVCIAYIAITTLNYFSEMFKPEKKDTEESPLHSLQGREYAIAVTVFLLLGFIIFAVSFWLSLSISGVAAIALTTLTGTAISKWTVYILWLLVGILSMAIRSSRTS